MNAAATPNKVGRTLKFFSTRMHCITVCSLCLALHFEDRPGCGEMCRDQHSSARIQADMVQRLKKACRAGSYDHFLNFQIGFIIVLQLAMCVFCAVAAYIWRNHSGWPRDHLAMYAYVQGNFENGAAYTFILLITFWILFSYLVPISLFVTMEIVKFWQVKSSLLAPADAMLLHSGDRCLVYLEPPLLCKFVLASLACLPVVHYSHAML